MNNLDLQYQALVRDILENGVKKQTRNGETLSVFGRQIRHNLKDGKFPLLTTKKMYWKGIVTELIWFLRGDTNIKFLVDNDCHIWDGDAYKKYCKVASQIEEPDYYYHVDDPNQNRTRILTQEEFIERIKSGDEKFIKEFGELGPIYGRQWREWSNYRQVGKDPYVCEYRKEDPIDQIANLIKELKENPDSRRMLVSAWNVSELENMTLPPCHYSFQVYTRELSDDERQEIYEEKFAFTEIPEEKGWDYKYKVPKRAISLMFNCRSQDVPLGTPFNIASYALLLNFIAKVVNMVPEEIIGNFGDCHIYTNQIEGLKEQLDRKPYELPSVILNTEFWPNNMENGDPVGLSENVWHIIENLEIDDFILDNYISHPKIKLPLSN